MAVIDEPTSSRSGDLANGVTGIRTEDDLSSAKLNDIVKVSKKVQSATEASKTKSNNKKNDKIAASKESKLSKQQAKKKSGNNDKSSEQMENANSSSSSRLMAGKQVINQARVKPLLVEELKLFQNNNLLNQQDPIQQLQAQLNELIRDDDNSRPRLFPNQQQHQEQTDVIVDSTNRLSANVQEQPPLSSGNNHTDRHNMQSNPANVATCDSESDNIFTIKKGVLWQQQHYDKFHQRLFSRWKKRYFILTTDYLVCFKRSACKVGRSEMGKFLYKTSLNDITNIEWLKPKKSDKGAIILHLNGQFNLFLWSKQNLDEWMFMIKESTERNKIRRTCLVENVANKAIVKNGNLPINNDSDLYENTNSLLLDQIKQQAFSNQVNGIQLPVPFGNAGETGSNSRTSASEKDQQIVESIQHSKTTANNKNEEEQSIKALAELRSQEKITAKQQMVEENGKRIGPKESTRNKSDENFTTETTKSSCSSSQATLESDRPNLIERKSSKDNTGDELDQANGKKVDIVRASGKKSRKAMMINDGGSSKEGSRERKTRRDHSSPSSSSSGSALASKRSITSGKAVFRASELNEDENRNDLSSASRQAPPTSDDKLTDKVRPGALGEPDPERGAQRRRTTDDENDTASVDVIPKLAGQKKNYPGGGSELEATAIKARPIGNLMRRDDSWQSLVSLTRIGKSIAPTAVQVAQRSLYAQHIMPKTGFGDGDESPARNRQHMINIESSVTPIRRHQSIQASAGSVQRRARQFPALQSTSLDLPNLPHQLANQPNQLAHTTSYQQKLLQLQLLHNSNNVDYIRNNGSDSNDYQVYSSNHYGYSSMRSNLKSAASEFSFIRPYSANRNQSTLPHQNHHHHHQQQQQEFVLNNQNDTRAIRQNQAFNVAGKTESGQLSDNNNNRLPPMTAQFLVNPVTGDRIINQGTLVPCDDFAPPLRDLPLKPNKKRAQNAPANCTNGTHSNGIANLPKSSSLTSSIACFFRRAFSRRSKKDSKKVRSRLAESCSSSLGAFEAGLSVVPVVPSAFSTGSKSVDGRNKDFNNNDQNNNNITGLQQTAQSQRMVDMIEAFTNRALNSSEHNQEAGQNDATRQYSAFNMDFNKAVPAHHQRLPAPPVTPSSRNQLNRNINQFGSPLHKSNSISATMGLSLAQSNNRRTFLQDNELMANAYEGSSSPMLMRSTKVMSAHLTPLMLQRESGVDSAGNHQFILSPRNSKLDQMPRPSSIYGQPSMISSPIIGSRDESRGHNFGVHRNSLHNHQFRDNAVSVANTNFDMRRHNQMMKLPFLDTTREVAEELASPTTELPSREFDLKRSAAQFEQSPQAGRYLIKRDYTFDVITSSPSNGGNAHTQYHHQTAAAVVNPILQSPTMDTIYDNHPMLNGAELASSYSHYDNHSQHQTPSAQQRLSSGNSMTKFQARLPQSDQPTAHFEDHYFRANNANNIKPQSYTPSRQSRLSDADRHLTVTDMMMSNKKPSAIVAPSTPNHSLQLGINDQLINRANSPQSPLILSQSRSPMMSRRAHHHQQSHYQQSPLVSQQTRVLSKGDGVQATVIGDTGEASHYRRGIGQPVVNIAGAPGINLEPSLAASLLRGTNIDAYRSSTFDRGTNQDDSQLSSKTFLVSTRLSKSIASSQSSSNYNGSGSSMSRDEQLAMATDDGNGNSISNNTTGLKSSKPEDELSAASSGSRSISSSIGKNSLRARRGSRNNNNNQEDQLESSSGTDTQGSKGFKNNKNHVASPQKEIRGYIRGYSSRSEKESSSEPSEEATSHRSSLEREVDERNWITSKLVE